jgi:type II secretory pathway pseudopilin PulG
VVGLSVLAIAAGVFVFSGLGNLDSGPGYKLTRAKTDLRAIQTAIDLFNARERRYPTNSEGLGTLVPTYLHAVPKDKTRGAVYISIDMMERVYRMSTRPDQTESTSTARVMISPGKTFDD